jgi:hypothetical protein
MTTDNKPPMFGPSGVFDPATYEPRSGKTFWMAATDVSSLANKHVEAETLIGNCTTSIPFKFDFDPKDNGHTLMFGTTREGMSGMLARPSLLPMSVPSRFAADVLMALGCQRDALESDGVSLADLSRVLKHETHTRGRPPNPGRASGTQAARPRCHGALSHWSLSLPITWMQ